MPDTPFAITMKTQGDITIFAIHSPRISAELAESFEEQVVRRVARLGSPKVLLDFSEVRFLCSAVLGKLIKLNGNISADRGGQLRLCALAPRIAEVFKITGLDKLFSIHKTRDDALRAFK